MITHHWWNLKRDGGLNILWIALALPVVAAVVIIAGAGVLSVG
jgi:hypothetical protein